MQSVAAKKSYSLLLGIVMAVGLTPAAAAQTVTYQPYIELGDAGPFGPSDQMVVAWQTDESSPNRTAYRVEFGKTLSYRRSVTPSARVVNNYLAVDPSLPVPPTAPGPHSDYTAVLHDLEYNMTYFYRVMGPGMPAEGFASSFHTRKRGSDFSFLVQGDECFFRPYRTPPRRALSTMKLASFTSCTTFTISPFPARLNCRILTSP